MSSSEKTPDSPINPTHVEAWSIFCQHVKGVAEGFTFQPENTFKSIYFKYHLTNDQLSFAQVEVDLNGSQPSGGIFNKNLKAFIREAVRESDMDALGIYLQDYEVLPDYTQTIEGWGGHRTYRGGCYWLQFCPKKDDDRYVSPLEIESGLK